MLGEGLECLGVAIGEPRYREDILGNGYGRSGCTSGLGMG